MILPQEAESYWLDPSIDERGGESETGLAGAKKGHRFGGRRVFIGLIPDRARCRPAGAYCHKHLVALHALTPSSLHGALTLPSEATRWEVDRYSIPFCSR